MQVTHGVKRAASPSSPTAILALRSLAGVGGAEVGEHDGGSPDLGRRRSARLRRRANHHGHASTSRQPSPTLPDAPDIEEAVDWEQYAKNKSRFYVTELVAPSWCEQAYVYGVLAKSHLPVSQRPESIVTKAGAVIPLDLEVAKRQEKVQERGKQIHERLERDVHPEKVVLRIDSREDAFAQRILALCTGLHTLMRHGCVREMPVFGWVHGRFVTGIIDEVSRRPLARGWQARSQGASDLASQGSPPPKLWASQEEWKRDATRKAKTRDAAKAAGTKDILSFFSPSRSQSKPHGAAGDLFAETPPTPPAPQTPQRSPGKKSLTQPHGYFLSDAKTRLSNTLPLEDAQLSGRLQLMLYKRLLDGLLGGFLPDSIRKAVLLDPHANSVDLATTFVALGLDAHQPLSEAFLEDAKDVLEEMQGLPMVANDSSQGSEGQPGATLSGLAALLSSALVELAEDAIANSPWRRPFERAAGHEAPEGSRPVHVVQPLLSLVYHRQKQRGRWRALREAATRARRGTAREERRPDSQPISAWATPRKLARVDEVPSTPQSRASKRQSPSTIDATPTSTASSSADAHAKSRDVPLTSVTSSPTSARRGGANHGPSVILGTVRFRHDASRLEAHLADALAFWTNARAPRGVDEASTWKCGACAFRDGCEYRERMGRRRWDEYWALRRADGGGGGHDEDDGGGGGDAASRHVGEVGIRNGQRAEEWTKRLLIEGAEAMHEAGVVEVTASSLDNADGGRALRHGRRQNDDDEAEANSPPRSAPWEGDSDEERELDNLLALLGSQESHRPPSSAHAPPGEADANWYAVQAPPRDGAAESAGDHRHPPASSPSPPKPTDGREAGAAWDELLEASDDEEEQRLWRQLEGGGHF